MKIRNNNSTNSDKKKKNQTKSLRVQTLLNALCASNQTYPRQHQKRDIQYIGYKQIKYNGCGAG